MIGDLFAIPACNLRLTDSSRTLVSAQPHCPEEIATRVLTAEHSRLIQKPPDFDPRKEISALILTFMVDRTRRMAGCSTMNSNGWPPKGMVLYVNPRGSTSGQISGISSSITIPAMTTAI